MTDIDPKATITSIDGMNAFDLISRRAMLEELSRVPGGREVLPFVLMFHGTPSSYMWEDGTGTMHRIAQGEGGEQGDPLMPLLYALGQHQALVAAKNRLAESEKVFAFHDDVYMVTSPARVGVAHTAMQEELFRHASIQIRGSKTKVWNR